MNTEVQTEFKNLKLGNILNMFSLELTYISASSMWDREKWLTLHDADKNEIYRDIEAGKITLPCLIESINKSFSGETIELVKAYNYEYCTVDDFEDNYGDYLLIATIDGMYFFVKGKVAFVEYDSISNVRQNTTSITISAGKVQWYSSTGSEIAGNNEIVLELGNEQKLLRVIRKCLKRIISICSEREMSEEDSIEEIVTEHIKRIVKSKSAEPYIVKEFDCDDNKKWKRLYNALSSYAHRVRKDEVIAFVDTSLFGNGKDGILFSKQGIAFDYAFEKVFIKYEEIEDLEIQKGKDLAFIGNFSEREDDSTVPSISNIYFNLDELKECLEDIIDVI